MPEETGPLRDLHPQILRRGARAGEFNSLQAQRETCEPRTRRLGVPCLKVIVMGGFSGAVMDRSLRRLLADIAQAQREACEAFIASQRHARLLEKALREVVSYALSASSSALASLRSGVSKPSVNQP